MVAADTSVRLAWPADADAMAAVQHAAWEQRYGATAVVLPAHHELATAWAASLARPPQARHRALVALAHEQVVGFVLCGPSPDPDSDPARDGELAELTVTPTRTRDGHGSRLVQAGVDTLAADGFERALLWVDTTDDVLRAFLADGGWEPDGAARELGAEDGGPTLRQVRLHVAVR